MKLYKVGDKSKAICPFCKQVRTTTFAERDVPLRSGRGSVSDVLVAVCDSCDKVVGIPAQSAPRIAERLRRERHSLEARIPRQLSDAMALACQEFRAPDGEVALFRYYVHRIAGEARLRTRLKELAQAPEADGPASARFSAKLNDEAYERFTELVRETGLNAAGVIKGLIVQMMHDVFEKKDTKVRRELQTVLQVAAS